MNIVAVESLELPELAPYRTLRQPVEHFREGFFVAEGEKVVRRLLAGACETRTLLLTPAWLDQLRPALERYSRERNPLTLYLAEKEVVEQIVGFNLHQGIMAIGKVPKNAELEEMLRMPPQFIAALDGLTNSENIGVLIRNAAAFKAQGVIAGETSSSPYLRRAVRNSMGTVFSLPVYHSADLAATLRLLREKHGIISIAAHPAGETPVTEAPLAGPVCIVFGSEGEGVSETILKACDIRCSIPMPSHVDSLNVASAASVFFYETYRRRALAGKKA